MEDFVMPTSEQVRNGYAEARSRPDGRDYSRAIVDTLFMWTNPRYAQFLTGQPPPVIDRRWFEEFLRDWRVARTLRADGNARERVRRYLDTQLRRMLAHDADGAVIDRAADALQKRGLGSQEHGGGLRSRPVSVVSKIAFFLAPHRIVPFDSLALKGLNALRGKTDGGAGRLAAGNYREYLSAFNEQFRVFRPEIESELQAAWVGGLARKLGAPVNVLESAPFRRKLFDDILMSVAGRYGFMLG